MELNMPVKSKAQQAYLAIHHPEVLDKWKKEEGSIYSDNKKYKDLPKHVKKAFDLVEADVVPGTYSESKTKTEAAYREGRPGKSCAVCVNFMPPSECSVVELSVQPNALCDYFEENESKTAALLSIYRRSQGNALRKVAEGSVSAGASVAALLDKEIQENKASSRQVPSIKKATQANTQESK